MCYYLGRYFWFDILFKETISALMIENWQLTLLLSGIQQTTAIQYTNNTGAFIVAMFTFLVMWIRISTVWERRYFNVQCNCVRCICESQNAWSYPPDIKHKITNCFIFKYMYTRYVYDHTLTLPIALNL